MTQPARWFEVNPWQVTERRFDSQRYRMAEGVLALANGYMGQRASFEEGVGGAEALRGNYVAGVFDSYPNPQMIQLKGRPSHPKEMVNLPDHLPLRIEVDGQALDLGAWEIESYERTLRLDEGVLRRRVTASSPAGTRIRAEFTRFLSRTHRHIAATRVRLTVLDKPSEVTVTSLIDGEVTNVRHRHFDVTGRIDGDDLHGLTARTLDTDIDMAVAASERITGPDAPWQPAGEAASTSVRSVSFTLAPGEPATIDRLAAVATSRDIDGTGDAAADVARWLTEAHAAGFGALLDAQRDAWADVWRQLELEIDERSGSGELTQGLRYCLFQMLQSAPNADHTVNIGAKGLTGEHYFGTYFWDTEVFMLPMFALTAPEVAKGLVRFRVHTLDGAKAKAAELDCRGAAFPFMADADGGESCTLWQFALLGIHITADVAWGVWHTYCATGDIDLVADGGIDVMVETSRFWLSRVYHREATGEYVINRVLGPDEYHQGVDNNYYTNLLARENLLNTGRLLAELKEHRPEQRAAAIKRLGLSEQEIARFEQVGRGIRLPYHEPLGVDLQDDRFDLLEPHDLRADPPGGALNAVWSYDRIMRTQLLRQGDVIAGHVICPHHFEQVQVARDFDYYEPKTTHDSSLSFCHHSIVAARLGRVEQAYDYFLKTARLDLDDLHGNAWQGIHTANMGGAWQCVVLGFAGLRWDDGRLSLSPVLPPQWSGYCFSIWFHGVRLRVAVREGEVELTAEHGEIDVTLCGESVRVGPTPVTQSLPATR